MAQMHQDLRRHPVRSGVGPPRLAAISWGSPAPRRRAAPRDRSSHRPDDSRGRIRGAHTDRPAAISGAGFSPIDPAGDAKPANRPVGGPSRSDARSGVDSGEPGPKAVRILPRSSDLPTWDLGEFGDRPEAAGAKPRPGRPIRGASTSTGDPPGQGLVIPGRIRGDTITRGGRYDYRGRTIRTVIRGREPQPIPVRTPGPGVASPGYRDLGEEIVPSVHRTQRWGASTLPTPPHPQPGDRRFSGQDPRSPHESTRRLTGQEFRCKSLPQLIVVCNSILLMVPSPQIDPSTGRAGAMRVSG
jgi:hypothetical protein